MLKFYGNIEYFDVFTGKLTVLEVYMDTLENFSILNYTIQIIFTLFRIG